MTDAELLAAISEGRADAVGELHLSTGRNLWEKPFRIWMFGKYR